MVRQGDLELSLGYNNSESITARYLQTAESVCKFSKNRFGDEEHVKLIVVTKGKPREACLEVISAGAVNLGENYPEETVKKFSGVNLEELNFHMIGHIQSRKIKLLHPLFSYIHSIDSKDLALKVSNHFAQQGSKVNALIEVNLTTEDSKSGFKISNPGDKAVFIDTFEELFKLRGFNILGLTTMGYYPENEEVNRNTFKECCSLLNTLQNRYKIESFAELSMGTSRDYKTAIAEGATMVRVGELIMGPRLSN